MCPRISRTGGGEYEASDSSRAFTLDLYLLHCGKSAPGFYSGNFVRRIVGIFGPQENLVEHQSRQCPQNKISRVYPGMFLSKFFR